MKCSRHGHNDCRECFAHTEDEGRKPTFEPCTTDAVELLVRVTIDKNEMDKLNRKATAVGRTPQTPEDVVENLISGALRHQWVCQEVKTSICRELNFEDRCIDCGRAILGCQCIVCNVIAPK